jgi:3-phenylpropionate/cinnamic acid dioxygenase small subunit
MAEKFNVQDRLEIMDVLNRYAWGYDSRDLTMLVDCFAEDGSYTIHLEGTSGWGPVVGRANLVEMMEGFMKQQTDQRRHCLSNFVFKKQDENYAEVISYLTLTSAENNEVRVVASGWYRDEMIKEDGAWRIKTKNNYFDTPF